ncbi:hypothetical protein IG631_24008 [Alternaria alternata]|nr:hypothetical protein IG631_24342 [Alternaria alternata]KAH8621373.1 hypothetical protein IG631_24008 [Alternaria alternata]
MFRTAQPVAVVDVIHHDIVVPGVSLFFNAVSVPSTPGTIDAVASVRSATRHCQPLLSCLTNCRYPK